MIIYEIMCMVVDKINNVSLVLNMNYVLCCICFYICIVSLLKFF